MPHALEENQADSETTFNQVASKSWYQDNKKTSALSLTELLTGLDLLPYRQIIFSGDILQVQQAIKALLQQLDLDRPFVTHNARIQMLLAMAYYVLGQHLAAYNCLMYALEQIRSTGSHRLILDEHPLLFKILEEVHNACGNKVALSSEMQDYINNLLKIIKNDHGNEAYVVDDQITDRNKDTVLSQRETEILLLVEQGSSDGQIADSVFLSIHTVKWHLRNIYNKLQVRSRTQAVAEARQQQILD